MPPRALTSAVVALLLALAPATAFADGAGDEQYQDPLAAPTAPKKPKKKATTAPAATAPAATTAPAAAAAPTSTSATQPASTASASGQELPRTGAPAGLIGLAGATLIVSGGALRRRTSPQ
jgi:LPXTG-motif cell wall-anchored protein